LAFIHSALYLTSLNNRPLKY